MHILERICGLFVVSKRFGVVGRFDFLAGLATEGRIGDVPRDGGPPDAHTGPSHHLVSGLVHG